MKYFITTIKSWDGFNNRWVKEYTYFDIKAINAKEAKKKCVERYLETNDIKVEFGNNRVFSVVAYEKTGRATPFNVVADNKIIEG